MKSQIPVIQSCGSLTGNTGDGVIRKRGGRRFTSSGLTDTWKLIRVPELYVILPASFYEERFPDLLAKGFWLQDWDSIREKSYKTKI